MNNETNPNRPETEKPVVQQPEALLPTPEQAEDLRPGEEMTQTDQEQHAEAMVEQAELAEDARGTVEQTAESDNPLERYQAAEADAAPPVPTHVNSELKGITLNRELKQIQSKESAPDRALSRVIHQPVVRVVSDALGKTVNRPSGLLGAGVAAFIGSSAYLYLAKYIGFEYNYFVFTLFFVGGFLVGLLTELLVWLVSSRHKASS